MATGMKSARVGQGIARETSPTTNHGRPQHGIWCPWHSCSGLPFTNGNCAIIFVYQGEQLMQYEHMMEMKVDNTWVVRMKVELDDKRAKGVMHIAPLQGGLWLGWVEQYLGFCQHSVAWRCCAEQSSSSLTSLRLRMKTSRTLCTMRHYCPTLYSGDYKGMLPSIGQFSFDVY